MILYLFIALLSFAILFLIIGLVVGALLSAPVYQGPKSDHFDGKRFINIGGAKAKGFRDVIKWMRTSQKRPPWQYRDEPQIKEPIENFTSEGKARVFFINHSSFLIQINGKNFLTDPVFSSYASPFNFAGPQRMRPPGIDIDVLPTIDGILLSHNHYDHCDIPALKRLHAQHDFTIFCPLGVDLYLRNQGFQSVEVLDWYDSITFENLTIHATPAQHFSARGMFDRDRTLWCGFVLESSDLKIYYVGDTGYGPIFPAIGQRLGPFDLSIIPIGAYQPRWFMQPIHCDPEQAIRIHHDVQSRLSIPCHYGTFPLAIDGQDEPLEELIQLEAYQKIADQFPILPEGQFIIISNT